MSVRMGSDRLCHMPKPEAGYHWWHQHCHLCVGDRNLQGEGQITYAQTGKGTTAKKKKSAFRIFSKLINRDNSCSHSALCSTLKSKTTPFFTLTSRVRFFFLKYWNSLLCLFSCIAGATGSHRRCNVSDSIVSVPHRCERLTGSNLHHLGPQQIIIRHPAQGASSTCLCSVHQWTDGEPQNAVFPPIHQDF